MFASLRIYRAAALMAAAAAAVLVCGLVRSFSADRAAAEGDGADLPIIMYHSVVKGESQSGEYVLSAAELEADLQYITQAGYTSVFCTEVADHVKNGTPLPEKPIVLTFDDGCYNNFYYVLPLLEKYKCKGVFCLVGEWCTAAAEEASPNPAYSTMDIENARTMALSGWCELACHSWDMHALGERRGVSQMAGESDEDYCRALRNDTHKALKILEKALPKGEEPVTYAYPYGMRSELTEDIVRQFGFEVTLSCEERVNRVAVGDESSLSFMGRFNRPAGISSADFFKDILK